MTERKLNVTATKHQAQKSSEQKHDALTPYCSHGVPIYNPYYKQFTNFSRVPHTHFAHLLLAFGIKTDLKIHHDLRKSGNRPRFRTVTINDAADCGFVKVVSDPKWLELFHSCFGFGSDDDREEFELNLAEYCDRNTMQQRQYRPFKIYDEGYFILAGSECRLYLLLKLCAHFVIYGIAQTPPIKPPWFNEAEIDLT